MRARELLDHLQQLGLGGPEAAQLLSVSPRTLRRWLDGEQEIPGPAEQALQAWLRLHRRGLAWRPEEAALADEDDEAIARHRAHAIDLDALLERVRQRGGPAVPWNVDLEKCKATLGPLQVTFYRLRNGGFSPQSFRRTDGPPDMTRDWPLLEDAYACIARALADDGGTPRPALALEGPSLHEGRLRLWGFRSARPIVAVIPCQTLRDAWALDASVSDEECRRLAMSNRELLAELAEKRFASGLHEVKEHGLAVVELDEKDLRAVVGRISRTILHAAAQWLPTPKAIAPVVAG